MTRFEKSLQLSASQHRLSSTGNYVGQKMVINLIRSIQQRARSFVRSGEVLCSVAHCKKEDVDKAVIAARRSFNDGEWSRAEPEHRKEVLTRLSHLIRENAFELAVLESLDSGKTITDCLKEIGTEVANFFQWYGELIDKSFGKVAPTGESALALIVKEPAGVGLDC